MSAGTERVKLSGLRWTADNVASSPQTKRPQRLPGPSASSAYCVAPVEAPEGRVILPKTVVARYRLESYVSDTMQYAFSLPTKADKVPAGSDLDP
jgi:hypothetical protein